MTGTLAKVLTTTTDTPFMVSFQSAGVSGNQCFTTLEQCEKFVLKEAKNWASWSILAAVRFVPYCGHDMELLGMGNHRLKHLS